MQAKEASPHPPPASGATAQWEAKRKESAPTHNSAPPVAYRCRVHKPGVPRGPASTPRLGPSGQYTTHGPAQGSKTTGQKSGPVTDRKVWPKGNNARSSTTSAHLSDRSARFGLQPPPDGLSDRKAWPKHYFRLRPRIYDRGSQKPCSPLFSD